MNVTERFLKYVSYDTESVDDVEEFPSAEKEKLLLNELLKELKDMAVKAEIDKYSYVTAVIPSNTDKKLPKLCFIAHVDTSPAVSGKDVKPRIIKYEGGDILLNKELGISITEKENPELLKYIGKELIVTDGTTLLGADDKAGVAEIMSAVDYIVNHPEFKHGEIRIAFTPDEEVGRGVDFFDVSKFGADFGYTVDGGELGEIEYENFNAAAAKIEIKGVSIHPGSAKNKMINAIDVFGEFHSLLPVSERPRHTENYEGFYMADDIRGNVENLICKYIIRDHDKVKFENRKKFFALAAEFINNKYGANVITATIKDSYYNMGGIINNNFHLIDNAVKAMQNAGVKPNIIPIRGGTDGARLSYEGLPCPNLSTGGLNFHGRKEFIPVLSMKKMTEVILEIVKLYLSSGEKC